MSLKEGKKEASKHKNDGSQLKIYSDHLENQLIINLEQEKVITILTKERIRTYLHP